MSTMRAAACATGPTNRIPWIWWKSPSQMLGPPLPVRPQSSSPPTPQSCNASLAIPPSQGPANTRDTQLRPLRSRALAVKQDSVTGEPVGFHEVPLKGFDSSATNSLSLSRRAERKANVTFGSTTQYPFRPGGMDGSGTSSVAEAAAVHRDLGLDGPLLDTPPGFTSGLQIAGSLDAHQELLSDGGGGGPGQGDGPRPAEVLSLAAILDLAPEPEEEEEEVEAAQKAAASAVAAPTAGDETEKDTETLQQALGVGVAPAAAKSGARKGESESVQWACVVDEAVKVRDFAWQVPNPAYTWPFELDDFQKQAVIRLEQHESVFVAAHTSAGKTVVAEYVSPRAEGGAEGGAGAASLRRFAHALVA